MKIGARAHDFKRQSPEGLAKTIRGFGFEAVQFAPYKAVDIEGDFLLEANVDRIAGAIKDENLQMSVLGCYVESGSLDDAVHEEAMRRFEAHLRVAKRLGAICVGTETTHFSGNDEEREIGYRRVLAFAKRMAQVAKEADALVAIEPVYKHTIHTPEMMKRLIDEVNSPYLKVIFDPVNLMHEGNEAAQEALWERCIDCFGAHVVAMHIKDGYYKGDDYIKTPLGRGAMRYQVIAEWLKGVHPDMPLLREEVASGQEKEEIAFIRGLFF